jgi:LPXTG-motif cell wall-anchored protein
VPPKSTPDAGVRGESRNRESTTVERGTRATTSLGSNGDPQLPLTGSAALPLALIGLALLAVGVVLRRIAPAKVQVVAAPDVLPAFDVAPPSTQPRALRRTLLASVTVLGLVLLSWRRYS